MQRTHVIHNNASGNILPKIEFCHTVIKANRGVAGNLFWRGTKTGGWGQKSPSGVQGQSPGGGRPPEAEDI